MKLRPFQQQLKQQVYDVWREKPHAVVGLVLPTGGGKCLGIDTPVLMHDGTVKMVQDIRVGDVLMGPDSAPRNVLSLARGSEQLYRVTPVKGDSYVVNESHILSLKMTGTGEVVNLSVREYMSASATFRHCAKGWRSAVDFPVKHDSLLIPPYLMGVWLGDGNSRWFSFTTGDPEIAQEVMGFASDLDMTVRVDKNSPGSVNLRVVNRLGRAGVAGAKGAPLGNELRKLDLIRNKHIPHRYKTGSKSERLNLLAGILDTDGYYNGKGFDLVLSNERLMDDVIFVARSLGFAAYKSSCRKTCTNNGVTGDYWRCFISGNVENIPCKIARHKCSVRQQIKNPLVTGITVESIGVGDYYGFEIDGDHLFMLGDFTVTHNTFTFSSILADHQGMSCAIAHRKELVGQMAMALARCEVPHRIIAPPDVVKQIVQEQLRELGTTWFNPNAMCAVAGVNTLVNRTAQLEAWMQQVTLWVIDEAHHLVRDTVWGKAVEMFPNARGLGVTATPCRSDGRGLGRHADGYIDTLVQGPTMRWLIDEGYLTDYAIFCPPSDVDLSTVPVSDSTGDYSKPKLVKAVKESHIVGDVLAHYLKIARGKLAVIFGTDVETATDFSASFNQGGVKCEVITGNTDAAVRADLLRQFRKQEIDVLSSVDIFSEGFDMPAIYAAIFARPTASYGLYVQQFGRALRPIYAPGYDLDTRDGRLAAIAAGGKPKAIIIDHVGNVLRHGLPDAPRVWSLDSKEKRPRSASPDDEIPLRPCPQCTRPYERCKPVCPHCGHKPEPAGRSSAEMVEGNLFELDAATLARMRADVARVDDSFNDVAMAMRRAGAPEVAINSARKQHGLRQDMQAALRASMAWWAGHQRARGRSDEEAYSRFFHAFGIDVLSAQALGRPEAMALADKINLYLAKTRAP